MRSLMIFAGLLTVTGIVMARTADQVTSVQPARAETVQDVSSPPSTSGARSTSIPRDRRGHFQTDARIEGRNISVMVDTGASVVALNESSAARIGVRPARNDYTANVVTANGTVKAARTRLASVDVDGVVVRDVDAMVLPDEALSQNLLGMAYLSRLKRFEYADGRLILER